MRIQKSFSDLRIYRSLRGLIRRLTREKPATIRGSEMLHKKSFNEDSFTTGEKEFAVISFLYDQGVNMLEPVGIDPETFSFITHHVEGEPFDPKDEKRAKKVLEHLARMHSVKVPKDLKRMLPSYSDDVWYADFVGEEHLEDAVYNLSKRLDVRARCITHEDLSKVNIFTSVKPTSDQDYKPKNGKSNGIVLIDFDRAKYGCPEKDLASFIHVGCGALGTDREKKLVQLYQDIYLNEFGKIPYDFGEGYRQASCFHLLGSLYLATKYMKERDLPVKKRGELQKSVESIVSVLSDRLTHGEKEILNKVKLD